MSGPLNDTYECIRIEDVPDRYVTLRRFKENRETPRWLILPGMNIGKVKLAMQFEIGAKYLIRFEKVED